MSRSHRCVSAVLSAAFLAGATLVSAQQATQPAQPAQPRVQPAQPGQPLPPGTRLQQPGQVQPGQVQPGQAQPGQANQGMEARADAQLAACLLVDNQGEVAMGKLAAERAHNPQVKRFGEQMVEDHGEFITKLQRFAGQLGQGGGERRPNSQPSNQPGAPQGANQANQPQANQPQPNQRPADQQNAARNNADRPGAARAAGGQRGGALNFVALKREIGQQCLESTRKELQSKEGNEFDAAFMGIQIVKHMEAIDTMKVFKEHGSDEFAQTLDEGIRTAQTHLDHAKQLIKQLHGESANTARRESDK